LELKILFTDHQKKATAPSQKPAKGPGTDGSGARFLPIK
jgi:hypothetical protein